VPVVSEKLVSLELQKTASTFIGVVLSDLIGAEVQEPKHGSLPEDCRSKFVVGSVRNPWDYYVSLWSFGCQGEGGMYRRATQRRLRETARRLPTVSPLLHELRKPAPWWRGVYAEPHSPEQFRQWLHRVHDPDRASEFEPRYGACRFRDIAGYATYRYCHLYVDNFGSMASAATAAEMNRVLAERFLPDAMIRTERVSDDLLDALRGAGYDVDETLERKVRERVEVPVNRSQHLPYTTYYDHDSVELVAERDALIISRHGYEFGT
jgi:hypothetical protein